ncbi:MULTISPECIES: hypothetical protein [Bradyrhizobium]|uniref:hypothetical protein n=1 Tax=Bradyrhizobium TaxID=374 RepID=UPI000FE3E341|nr:MULTISPECIES: hypothetical protein [Bradyrhizobium]TGN73510.1 hypothetical protein EOW77_0034615 [Bradyrhizobium yuanmingense]UWU68075.1 hypothetical protein N2602_33945 [Bradyrhizobium sp. NC92]
MKQLSLCMVLCVVCGLLWLNEIARADATRRYECTIDGTDREPSGDRNGRTIVSFQYTCRVSDGLLKDGGITGLSVSEWDSEKGRYLGSIDVYRALDGIAVGQLLEATGSSVTENNRAIGMATSGKMVFKFASGSLAALSGRTLNFTIKPVSSRQFEMEFADWPEAGPPK